MKKVTLCFCVDENSRVLLGLKKRGFGVGKWNGYGGKVKKNESPRQATVRELFEESKLVADPKDLQQVALVHFYFAEEHKFDCYVFILYHWQGERVETEEMKPRWWPIPRLPFKKMWVADVQWLKFIFAGDKIEASVHFNEDGSKCAMFGFKPAKFD